VQTSPHPKFLSQFAVRERDLKGTVFAPFRLWEKGLGDEGKPHRYEIHLILMVLLTYKRLEATINNTLI
jgi:hypothetical protein